MKLYLLNKAYLVKIRIIKFSLCHDEFLICIFWGLDACSDTKLITCTHMHTEGYSMLQILASKIKHNYKKRDDCRLITS